MRTYRASSLGSCTKAQVALQCGYSPLAASDQMEGLYSRGRDHEVECIAALWAQDNTLCTEPGDDHDGRWGERLAWDQDQLYVELEVAGAKITGHLDGVMRGPFGMDSTWDVLEIKSPQSFHKWEKAHKTGDYSDPLMNRYAVQLSVYMLATGLEAVVACVEEGQVRTFGVETPPYDLSAITTLVAFMEDHVEAGRLPVTCSQSDYPCPVAYLHEKPEYEADEVLDQLVTDREFNRQMVKEWQAKVASLDARIAEYAVTDIETPTSKVTHYTTTRTTYDHDAMEKDGIDLSKYATIKESQSIRITKKEGGEL